MPERQRELLGDHLTRCAALAPGLRWVPAANLHLTLRFIGQTSPGLLGKLSDGLRDIPFAPFEVALGGAGWFGSAARVRVCWLGLTLGLGPLTALAEAVDTVCREAGLRPEPRGYNPHLTLARARKREGVELPELPPPPSIPSWQVDGFGLYQSRTGGGRARYTVLETYSG